MMKDALALFPFPWLMALALWLFLFAFLLVTFLAFSRSARPRHEQLEKLPLQEE